MDESQTRWNRALALFDEIFEMSDQAAAAHLDEACAGDEELKRIAHELLDAKIQAPTFLTDGALAWAEPLLGQATCDTPEQRIGQQIGPYLLTRIIGRGGMGVVYLGQRARGDFDHQVAIKLLPGGHHDAALTSRFKQEQKVLASLSNAAIARLYDGGYSDEGHPYIVMEYVEGTPIDRYCDDHQLTVRQRLELIMQVADALQHAHHNLIVHRDLKPSNILVTKNGRIKLLDFGIAKLLDNQFKDKALTQAGEQFLTPRYAAPEQMRGDLVSVATDVYQLGMLMFELLSGGRPYAEASGDYYSVAKQVCEHAPHSPSAAIANMDEKKAGDVARHRGMSVAQLQKTLRGDLNAITLHALGKQTHERYPSMQAMRADIAAYMDSLPIVAANQSLLYRATRFTRRHRFGVVAAISFCAIAAVYMVTLINHAERITLAWQQSQIEEHKSEQVSEFLIDLFSSSNPDAAPGQNPTVNEVLKTGQSKINQALADTPQIRSHMLHVLGTINHSLGNYKTAVDLLHQSLQIQRAQSLIDTKAVGQTLTQLGMGLTAMDNYTQAKTVFEEAVTVWRSDHHEPALLAESVNAYGLLLQRMGEFGQAELLFNEAILLLRQVNSGHNYELAVALNNLAGLHAQRSNYVSAERLMSEALELQEQVLGEDHSYYSVSLDNLARIQMFLGRYDDAQRNFQRALALQTKNLGPLHPYTAQTLYALGTLAHKRDQLSDAEQYLTQALAVQEQGDERIATASTLKRLGRVYQAMQRFDDAEEAFSRMLNIYATVHPANSPRIGQGLAMQANLARERGELASAHRLFERAFELLKPHSKSAATAHLERAKLYLSSGDASAAHRNALAALHIRRQSFPANHPHLVEVENLLSEIGYAHQNGAVPIENRNQEAVAAYQSL